MSRSREELLAELRTLLAELRELGDPGLFEEFASALQVARGDDAPQPDGAASRIAGDVDPHAVDGPDALDPDAVEWHGMIGRCPAMLDVRARVLKFAPTSSPVLIRGESGTGKDLVARILHELGPRRDHAMVSENCAAIPETLLESTLFGHVKGAFTGAVRDHPGHFVGAHQGTLFLDEIGDMPMPMQSKLLRVLQEGEVRPVGGERVRKVDVRVIAATHRDLEQLVAERRFRSDLFYRLNVLQLELPPLRERGDDVLSLARSILARVGDGRRLRLLPDAERAIRRYAWPGNIRQLQNEVQRVVALAEAPEVGAAQFSPDIAALGAP